MTNGSILNYDKDETFDGEKKGISILVVYVKAGGLCKSYKNLIIHF